jgi:hypothetical protein
MKAFTESDIDRSGQFPRIWIEVQFKELVYAPLWWHKQNLQQTASGYGAKLVSHWMLNFNGRLYRVYVTCYGNSGSSWVKIKGERIYIAG